MNKILNNWTYPKHAMAVTGLYLVIASIVNAILERKKAVDRKSKFPIKNFTKGQVIANSILSGAYIVDMTASYTILNAIRKRKNQL